MTKARDLANSADVFDTVSTTELGYLDGVTSAVQTQLDAKLATSTAATTYVANSVVDAKGDLLVGSADNTLSRLAVGSDGDTLVADSSSSTGLRWSATPSASNPIINSDFSIAQRGTTFASPTPETYTLDRWNIGNAFTTRTWSRQTASLDGFQYCARIQRDSGATAGALCGLTQSLETVNSIPYQGKTITISAWVRKGADFSGPSNVARLVAASGTGTDQKFVVNGGGYTGQSIFIDQNITLTTSWQRFSATGTVSASATELAFGIQFQPNGTAGAADYLEFTGYQVDIGSVALPYRRAMNTIQNELAACQRYYYRRNPNTAAGGYGLATIQAYNISNGYAMLDFPTTMRGIPTLTVSANANDYRAYVNNLVDLTAVPGLQAGGTDYALLSISATNGLYAVGAAGWLASDTAGDGFLAFSAEL